MRFRISFLLIFAFFAPGILLSGAKAQTLEAPKGIWFNNTQTVFNRFAYSQAILWPSAVAGHLYVYLREDNINWHQLVTLKTYQKTFTMPPVWDKDSISWNYGVHPIMGSVSYLAYRNKGGHWAEAFAGAAINSAIYEYLIAGGTQRPSINDLIVTPVLGSLLGEGIYRLKKRMVSDHYLSFIEKVIITATDPFEALYYGFNYGKICRASYR